jgi:hypothetical protein
MRRAAARAVGRPGFALGPDRAPRGPARAPDAICDRPLPPEDGRLTPPGAKIRGAEAVQHRDRPQRIRQGPPKPPPPNKYVEANPNAPDNVPDKTNNFSSQNQQLAQEKPQLDQHNDKPKLDGKKDIQSNQVVSGQLSKPQETVPPVTRNREGREGGRRRRGRSRIRSPGSRR